MGEWVVSVIFDNLREKISDDPSNKEFKEKGYEPLFVADERAKIVIVGHAPGKKAQEAKVAWGDKSGERLKEWLGIDEKIFRDESKIALIPMDFYYQGKGKSGDLPPRKDFAPKWHTEILSHMPNVKLIVLAGNYAQKYYLGKNSKKNLTETVRAYTEYLPKCFPIVHPSPLNFRWLNKNPWFEEDVVPVLKEEVKNILLK